MKSLRVTLLAWAVCLGGSIAADAQVLFFSRSSHFQHSCVEREGDNPSHVEKILKNLADSSGGTIDFSKDGTVINAENLANYTLVIFFTQGDLHHTPSKDEQPPVSEDGLQALLDWIKNGGGFLGFHCASDTMHAPEGSPPTPYTQMIGGEFLSHGKQFEGTVKVVDPSHPAMVNFPAEWTILDEWYVFKNLNKENIHVLALLDPGEERAKQEQYNIDSYPIVWCSKYGEGRVFFNAMGHREDVWSNETFQKTVVDAARWCLGEGQEQAEPNYAEVVCKSDAEGDG